MRGKKLREGVGLTVLNLFFIALCFVTLIPILYALSVSFNGQNALLSSDFSFIPKDFTLDNYLRVFTGEDIMTWFGNSVILAAATVAISLAAAVPAAYCFSRRSFPGRRLVLRWLVLLNSFPAILSMFAVYRLLRPMGLVNHRLGLIIVYTGTMAVFSLWNMKGYFDTVPVEIEEAARMDGASDLQVVTRIVLPLAKPSVIVTALMAVTLFAPLAWFAGDAGEFRLYAFSLQTSAGEAVQSTVYMGVVLALACVLPFITIFLFKRRLLQIRLCVVEIVLLIGSAVMEAAYYFLSWRVFSELSFHTQGFRPAIALPLVCLLFAYLAARAVFRDELMVRAADRIR